jgi:glycosyltransferase involved in cell wall biosynthesis
MKPLISVIITTKNEAEVIENLFKSLKKQTFRNFEVILVDNNSTDRTKEISKNYTKKVFNFGPERSSQRNYGAKISAGEYVLILDADMVLTKNVLKSCAKKVKEEKNVSALIIPEKS